MKTFSGALNLLPNGADVHVVLAPAGAQSGSASGKSMSENQCEQFLHKCGVLRSVSAPNTVIVEDVPAAVLGAFGFPGW